MKAGITIVLAVLALAVLALAQPQTLNLTLQGKSTPKNPTSSDPTRKWKHELTTATASGQSVGTLKADSEFKKHTKFGSVSDQPPPADPRCNNAPDSVDPKGKVTKKQWGSDLKKIKWTLTYNDGSKSGTLNGKETNASNTPVCTDGSEFYVKAKGVIQGGTGDFQGATGTWTGEMMKVDRACCTLAAGSKSCDTGSCPTTGTLVVNLN